MAATRNRLEGLDLARFVAFAGMVLVNFRVVSVAGVSEGAFVSFLEGKAAALFVVLAGVGLGLAARRNRLSINVTMRRAVFLAIIGLLNMLIFPADIIHYYAVYFALGIWFVGWDSRYLAGLMAFVVALSLIMLAAFDYNAGWDWVALEYLDFWSVGGFIRNLFYNGWHPVFPWITFLFFGFILARRDLGNPRTALSLVIFGAMVMLVAAILSNWLTRDFAKGNEDLVALFGTSPVPPVPLYLLIGCGGAMVGIGVSVLLMNADRLSALLRPFSLAGRMSLTLYFAHILIGMFIIDALGLIGGMSENQALIASGLFMMASLVFANLWLRFVKRGPLEELMRLVAG